MPVYRDETNGMLPGVVRVEAVVARNDEIAICFEALRAYPTGVEFEVRVLFGAPHDLPAVHVQAELGLEGVGNVSGADRTVEAAFAANTGGDAHRLTLQLRGLFFGGSALFRFAPLVNGLHVLDIGETALGRRHRQSARQQIVARISGRDFDHFVRAA